MSSTQPLDAARSEPSQPSTAAKPRRRWSISVVNFALDAFLLALLTLYGWVTAMLRIVFPAPTKAEGWKLWGWNFDQWWDFQFGTLCVFAVAALLHVMLHWNWVCQVLIGQILKSKARPDDAMRTIYGVGLLIALLHVIVIGVVAAMAGVTHPPR